MTQRRLHPGDPLQWGRRIRIQIRHAFNLQEQEQDLTTFRLDCSCYPSNVPNLIGSLDSGHTSTTVKTENSQPGLSQGQDPSSRVLLRSTRVATGSTHPLLFKAVDSNPCLNSAYLTASIANSDRRSTLGLCHQKFDLSTACDGQVCRGAAVTLILTKLSQFSQL